MHAKGQLGCHEELGRAGVADHHVLDVKLSQEYDQEPPVVMDELKHVQFGFLLTANFAAVEHVEDVHQHKGVEQKRHVLQTVGGLLDTIGSDVERILCDQVVLNSEHHRSEVQKGQHRQGLVDDLGEDLAPHDWDDELVAKLDSFLTDFGRVRGLGSHGNGSQHVHDQVDPEELHDGEGAGAEGEDADQHKAHAGNVDGQLELDELAAVLEDISTPFDRVKNGFVVVVHDDQARLLLGHSASRTHAEADISLAHSLQIGAVFTRDGHERAHFFQGKRDHILVVRSGPVDDEGLRTNFCFEVLFANRVLELPLFSFSSLVMQVLGVLHLLVDLVHDLLSRKHVVIAGVGLDDVQLAGNMDSDIFVVTRDNARVCLSLEQSADFVSCVSSWRVVESKRSQQGQVLFKKFFAFVGFEVLVILELLVEVRFVHKLVCQRDRLATRACYLIRDRVLQVFFTLVAIPIEGNGLVVLVEFSDALGHDLLRIAHADDDDCGLLISLEVRVCYRARAAEGVEGEHGISCKFFLAFDKFVVDGYVDVGEEFHEGDFDFVATRDVHV